MDLNKISVNSVNKLIRRSVFFDRDGQTYGFVTYVKTRNVSLVSNIVHNNTQDRNISIRFQCAYGIGKLLNKLNLYLVAVQTR